MVFSFCFLLALWICHLTVSWSPAFLLRNLRTACPLYCYNSTCSVNSLVWTCLGIFVLHESKCPHLSLFGKFSAIQKKNKLSSAFFSSEIPLMHKLSLCMVSHGRIPWVFFISFVLFFPLRLDHFSDQNNGLIQFCWFFFCLIYWISITFLFQSLLLSTPDFFLVPFGFLSICWTLDFIMILFFWFNYTLDLYFLIVHCVYLQWLFWNLCQTICDSQFLWLLEV